MQARALHTLAAQQHCISSTLTWKAASGLDTEVNAAWSRRCMSHFFAWKLGLVANRTMGTRAAAEAAVASMLTVGRPRPPAAALRWMLTRPAAARPAAAAPPSLFPAAAAAGRHHPCCLRRCCRRGRSPGRPRRPAAALAAGGAPAWLSRRCDREPQKRRRMDEARDTPFPPCRRLRRRRRGRFRHET